MKGYDRIWCLFFDGSDDYEIFTDYDSAKDAYLEAKNKCIEQFKCWNDECVYLREMEIYRSENVCDFRVYNFIADGVRVDIEYGLCGEAIEEAA